jgi:hypothetical protein
MRSRSLARHGRSVMLAAFVGGLVASPAAAASPAGANPTCAPVLPLAEIAEGQIGTGWTVVKGTTPEPFAVEVLGVFPDGVAPGKDMILVEVSDLPGGEVIAAGDGIWSGMSGSPVYIDGKLAGAVAYGFSTGPSRIGGLSPSEDMQKLLRLPDAAGTAVRPAREPRTRLSAAVRRTLGRLTGQRVAATGEFDRLTLPLAVSGVPAKGRSLLAERLATAGLDVRVTRGSSARRPAGSFVAPVPGGNFAASISYGDVTIGGVGTTTWVCGERALAFGHPLQLAGTVRYGASDARALSIVKDPTAGSIKLAAVTDPFGIVDQDRLSGIRARLGRTPPVYPVVARVRDLDLNAQRTGRTDVTSPGWMAYVGPQHLYADLITTTDRQGPGTTSIRYRISGQRANGDPWSLDVGDRLASDGEIQYIAAASLDSLLQRLVTNGTEAIRITRIRVDAAVREEVRAATIRRVLVSRNGGAFAEPAQLRLRTGDALVVRALLRDRDDVLRRVDVPLTVPAGAAGFGALEVAGGASLVSICDIDPSFCGPTTFKRLLQQIEARPRGDDLVVQLVTAGDGFESTVVARAKVRQPVVVAGDLTIEAVIR